VLFGSRNGQDVVEMKLSLYGDLQPTHSLCQYRAEQGGENGEGKPREQTMSVRVVHWQVGCLAKFRHRWPWKFVLSRLGAILSSVFSARTPLSVTTWYL